MTRVFEGKPETRAYVIDGKAHSASAYPRVVWAKAYWVGDSIVVEEEQEVAGYQVKRIVRYTLSADGKRLMIRSRSFASGIFSAGVDERVYERK